MQGAATSWPLHDGQVLAEGIERAAGGRSERQREHEQLAAGGSERLGADIYMSNFELGLQILHWASFGLYAGSNSYRFHTLVDEISFIY